MSGQHRMPHQYIVVGITGVKRTAASPMEPRLVSAEFTGRLMNSCIWLSPACLWRKATVLHQETLTSIKASSCGRPAHDRGDGSNHGSNPGIGDADPLQRCVTTGVQENVEDPQGPCEWIHSPGQQGHSWHRTTGGKRHS